MLCYPKCLHFLVQKGRSISHENVWEGKVKETRLSIENNANKLTTTLTQQLADVQNTILKGVEKKFKHLDKSLKVLQEQLENLERGHEQSIDEADGTRTRVNVGKGTR
jgi:hypothetical protein